MAAELSDNRQQALLIARWLLYIGIGSSFVTGCLAVNEKKNILFYLFVNF